MLLAQAPGITLPAPPPGLRLRLPRPSSLARFAARRRRLAIFLAVLALFGLGAGLWAYFTAPSIGPGASALGGTMPGGNTPTASVSGRDVTVSWAQNAPSFLGGGKLGAATGGGYGVKRYAESGGGS